MKKSFFALMLAAVLPAANAASVAELEERIEVLEARVASLERIILSGSRNPNRFYVCSVKPFQKLFEASGKTNGKRVVLSAVPAMRKLRRCSAKTLLSIAKNTNNGFEK